jgi:hypothetical protein
MTPQRLRLQSILVLVILNAIVLFTWTQPWYTLVLTDGTSILVAGDVAAPALSALALSGLALAGALTIAGVFFRIVLGVLQSLLGALVITSAALALADPVSAGASAITASTGVTGAESLAALVSSVFMSALPATALGTGVALVIVGALTVAFTRRWPTASRRFSAGQSATGGPQRSAIGDWDALTGGDDPTSERTDR